MAAFAAEENCVAVEVGSPIGTTSTRIAFVFWSTGMVFDAFVAVVGVVPVTTVVPFADLYVTWTVKVALNAAPLFAGARVDDGTSKYGSEAAEICCALETALESRSTLLNVVEPTPVLTVRVAEVGWMLSLRLSAHPDGAVR
jgi:hypothetical protein